MCVVALAQSGKAEVRILPKASGEGKGIRSTWTGSSEDLVSEEPLYFRAPNLV